MCLRLRHRCPREREHSEHATHIRCRTDQNLIRDERFWKIDAHDSRVSKAKKGIQVQHGRSPSRRIACDSNGCSNGKEERFVLDGVVHHTCQTLRQPWARNETSGRNRGGKRDEWDISARKERVNEGQRYEYGEGLSVIRQETGRASMSGAVRKKHQRAAVG